MSDVPLVIMTSPATSWTLAGMFWSLKKYAPELQNIIVCGYDEVMARKLPEGVKFHKIGEFGQFPKNKWSDSFMRVCRFLIKRRWNHFIFLMDDFWLVRRADVGGIDILWQGMRRGQNSQVLKIDLATDRLYAGGGTKYLYGANTVATEGHLDLIQSDPASAYHMSLWNGLFNAQLLLDHVLVPGESAQDMEIDGTRRLKEKPEILVLGTRQAPMRVTNICKSGHGPGYKGYELNGDWVNGVPEEDLEAMKAAGVEMR